MIRLIRKLAPSALYCGSAALAVCLVAALLSCGPDTGLSSTDYAVYSVAMNYMRSPENPTATLTGPDGQPATGVAAIMAQLDEEAPDSAGSRLSDSVARLKHTTIASYNTRPKASRLEARLTDIGPYELVDKADILSVFESGRWRGFYQRYPQSPGLFLLSRIGYDETGTQALIFVTEMHEGEWAQGSWYILEKVGNTWAVTESARVWVS